MGYFQDMVGRYSDIGIDEFVLYWPQVWGEAPHEEAVFEEVTATVMPKLRAGGRTTQAASWSRATDSVEARDLDFAVQR